MDSAEIQTILQNMGARVPPSSQLVLIGGSALILLGSPRLTVDIDFIGDDVHPNAFHQRKKEGKKYTLKQIAAETEYEYDYVRQLHSKYRKKRRLSKPK